MQQQPTYTSKDGWRYPTHHNQKRRHRTHDYNAVGTYLITIHIDEALAKGYKDIYSVFGKVAGNPRTRRGDSDYAHITYSPLGEVVLAEEVKKINHYYPMVQIWQFCLMPDHIHMIVRVASPMPAKKHLGHVIGAFKGGISRAWWRLQDEGRMPLLPQMLLPATNATGTGTNTHTSTRANAPTANAANALADNAANTLAANAPAVPAANAPAAPAANAPTAPAANAPAAPTAPAAPVSRASARDLRIPLFEEGYNDHILMREGQLNNWKAYLNDNPHRLLLRHCFPNIMERRLCITIAGTRYSAFGNFSLLKRPEKVQGQCHMKARYGDLTPEERQQYGYTYQCAPDMKTHIPYEETQHFRESLAHTMGPVRSGAVVLVTPGISEGEKQMKHEALNNFLPFIHLQKEPIPERWKPEKSRFYACAQGTLLILAPWQEDMNTEGYYATFHKLNNLAAQLCAMDSSQLSTCKVTIAE